MWVWKKDLLSYLVSQNSKMYKATGFALVSISSDSHFLKRHKNWLELQLHGFQKPTLGILLVYLYCRNAAEGKGDSQVGFQ